MNPLSDHQPPLILSFPRQKENQVRPGRERRLDSHLDSDPALSWIPTLINNTARSVIHLHVINREAWWLTELMFIIQLRYISPFCTKVPRSIYGQELMWGGVALEVRPTATVMVLHLLIIFIQRLSLSKYTQEPRCPSLPLLLPFPKWLKQLRK